MTATSGSWAENLLGPSFLRKGGVSPLSSLLADQKYLGLYFSAHWCGPCRGFTPDLAEWYSNGGKDQVEIVFISRDRDLESFKEYYDQMPWCALEYDQERSEKLMAQYHVEGIPTLVVLDAITGELITDEARGDIDVSNCQSAFHAWSPQGRAEKAKRKAEMRSQAEQRLPELIASVLSKLGVKGEVGTDELVALLQTAAQTHFKRSLPHASCAQVANNLVSRFADSATGNVSAESLFERLLENQPLEWLLEVSADNLQDFLYIGVLNQIHHETVVGEAWEQQTEPARQCKAIFDAFNSTGDHTLSEADFVKFMRSTAGEESAAQHGSALFNFLQQRSGSVTAEVIFLVVYHEVYGHLRPAVEGGVDQMIRMDFERMCSKAQSKL